MELYADTKKIRGACYNCGNKKIAGIKRKTGKIVIRIKVRSQRRKPWKLQAQKPKIKETRPEQKREESKAEILGTEHLRATEEEEIVCSPIHLKDKDNEEISDILPPEFNRWKEMVDKWVKDDVKDTDEIRM